MVISTSSSPSRQLPWSDVAVSARTMIDSVDLDRLSAFTQRSQRLMILTGAGCSTESGIPDYRDNGGDWKRQRPVQYQDFVRSRQVRQYYWARSVIGWANIARAEPNSAHRALAKLEDQERLHHLITQNVDGLHQKAGSRKVIDLHGRLNRIVCLDCGSRYSRQSYQRELVDLNPAWRVLSARIAPDGDVDLGGVDYETFQVTDCRKCGGMLKPDVVFFGESVPGDRVAGAFARLQEADALLVAGSSLMVWSGYRFVKAAVQQGIPVAAVNLGRTRADAELAFKVQGRCGDVLPLLIEQLR